ncbi:flagella basal body P-ring formation protein FlgA [Pleionea sp. CnH1-48]|uniref:flagella basal body P-ring formation protein FlgA n=1 Tax=Pleionea sp. CnH1-48 TaxID=2954494 RepID=UPI002097980F|nr:flagella basal body P-ring formation protein FlgA [Pleionea sp. CnH1-48]MCO7223719.1 flagella basal body P-ring formation protein FlgA [Pleionea sp. CnH1-48]
MQIFLPLVVLLFILPLASAEALRSHIIKKQPLYVSELLISDGAAKCEAMSVVPAELIDNNKWLQEKSVEVLLAKHCKLKSRLKINAIKLLEPEHIDREHLQEIAEQWLIRHYGGEDITMSFDNVSKLSSVTFDEPITKIDIVGSFPASFSRRMRVDMVLTTQSIKRKRLSLWLKVNAVVKGYEASHNLEAHYPLIDYGFREVTVPYFQSGNRFPVTHLDADRRLKTALTKGQLLTQEITEVKPLIDEGDKATLLVSNGAVMLEVDVKILESGKVGDKVSVLVLPSNTVISAKVLSKRHVRYENTH